MGMEPFGLTKTIQGIDQTDQAEEAEVTWGQSLGGAELKVPSIGKRDQG